MFGWLTDFYNSMVFSSNVDSFQRQIENGNTEEVKKLLDDCPALLTCTFGEDEEKPLGYAASYRRAGIVRLLLDRKVDAKGRDKSGNGAIHWAAAADRPAIIEMLLAAGESVNGVDLYGATPLLWAAEFGALDAVKHLLARKANAKAADKFGANAIHYLIDGGRCYAAMKEENDPHVKRWNKNAREIFRLLADSGADFRSAAKYYPAPVVSCMNAKLMPLLEEMIARGVSAVAGETGPLKTRQDSFRELMASGSADAALRADQIVNQIFVTLNQRRRDAGNLE